MASFAKYVGGSPTNTAIGAARLGLRAGLLTRVGDDHMGRFVREQLVREGVATQGVTTDPDRLTALVLLGIRDPETFPLIFHRENCADMALAVADIDPAFVASAGAVLVNGTHLSAPGVFAANMAAARLMRDGGGRVVFDIDFRPVLLGLSAAPAVLLERFGVAASYPIVKGFAVGRTIWHSIAADWLAGTIDEDAAMTGIAASFRVLVDAWPAARRRHPQPPA